MDIVGLIPGLGELADGLNGLIYLARGDEVNAALSFAAMVPFAGAAATVGKWGNKLDNAVDAADAVTDGVRAASRGGDAAATGIKAGDDVASSGARQVDGAGGGPPGGNDGVYHVTPNGVVLPPGKDYNLVPTSKGSTSGCRFIRSITMASSALAAV